MDWLRAVFAIVFTLGLFITSLLAHELGHTVAIWGMMGWDKVKTISAGSVSFFRYGKFRLGILPTWGYVLYAEDEATPEMRRIIAVAGPMASLVLAGVFSLLHIVIQAKGWSEAMYAMALANYAICGFNLIPIPPLDGWKVVETYLPSLGILLTKESRAKLYQWGTIIVVVGSCLYVAIAGPYHG